MVLEGFGIKEKLELVLPRKMKKGKTGVVVVLKGFGIKKIIGKKEKSK